MTISEEEEECFVRLLLLCHTVSYLHVKLIPCNPIVDRPVMFNIQLTNAADQERARKRKHKCQEDESIS